MTKFYTGTLIFLFACASAPARWSPVSSGTPNDLQSAQQLDSGVGLAVGDGGTFLKTTDLGASWPKGPLTKRSSRAKRSAAEESRGVSFEVSPRDPSTPPPAALGMTLLFSGCPLSGGAGIEGRLASGDYPTLVFTFGAPVTSVAAIGEAICERLGAIRIDSQDAHPLVMAATVRPLIARLMIEGNQGQTFSDATMSMGLLLGYGVIYDSDYEETKRNLGEITDNSTFREDLNADGRIDRNDARLIRRKNGSALLP